MMCRTPNTAAWTTTVKHDFEQHIFINGVLCQWCMSIIRTQGDRPCVCECVSSLTAVREVNVCSPAPPISSPLLYPPLLSSTLLSAAVISLIRRWGTETEEEMYWWEFSPCCAACLAPLHCNLSAFVCTTTTTDGDNSKNANKEWQ